MVRGWGATGRGLRRTTTLVLVDVIILVSVHGSTIHNMVLALSTIKLKVVKQTVKKRPHSM